MSHRRGRERQLTAATGSRAILLVLAILAGGCGRESGGAGQTAPTVASQPSAQVRVGLDAVTVVGDEGIRVFDATSGAARWAGGPAIVSHDGATAVTVTTDAGVARAQVRDAHTGTVTASVPLPAGATIAAMAADGSQFAVVVRSPIDPATQLPEGRDHTDVLLVPTRPGSSPPRTITVAGNVVPEAFSPSSPLLFVLAFEPAGHPDHYAVRGLDLASGRLTDVFTRAKQPLDEDMQGVGGAQVMSGNGRWLFTVYREFGSGGYAFVHALDLQNGSADCLELPHELGFGAGTVIASNTDGTRVYVVSARGVLAEVDNTTMQVARSFDTGVTAPSALGASPTSVVVGSTGRIGVIDPTGATPVRTLSVPGPVRALVVGTDGATAVVTDGVAARFVDLRQGREVRVLGG